MAIVIVKLQNAYNYSCPSSFSTCVMNTVHEQITTIIVDFYWKRTSETVIGLVYLKSMRLVLPIANEKQ